MSENIEFVTVSPAEWEEIPAPTPPKAPDRFEQLLISVGKGNIVKLEVQEEKDLRGTRIAIARKARNSGFIAEFRNLGTTLYIKRSERPLEAKQEKSTADNGEEKRDRKKKTEA